LIIFEYILLLISVLILVSIIMTKLSNNLGLPSLLIFLAIGMLAGTDGPGNIYFDDFRLSQAIGVVALVFILFSGGMDTKWQCIKSAMSGALKLSTLGVVLSALIIGIALYYIFSFPLFEGLLIGAIISSTDSAAVFSILRSKSLRLKGNVRSLLELESGSNDPMAIFLTLVLIEAVKFQGFDLLNFVFFFVMQFGVGAVVGIGMGKLLVIIMNKLKLPNEGFYSVFAITYSVLVYSVTAILNGSGFLAVYLAAVVIGNSEFVQKKSLLRFFDGIAFLGEVTMFLTLGLLVFPSQVLNVVLIGLSVSALLIFLARPLSVFLSLMFSKYKFREKVLVSWVGLRGAVPIILATFPITANLQNGSYYFNIIFFVVLTSVIIQGWSLPVVARALKLLLPESKVKKIPIELDAEMSKSSDLVDIIVPDGSPVTGKPLAELGLPEGCLITVIYRDDEYIIPSGSTSLEGGDAIIMLLKSEHKQKVTEIFRKPL